MDKSQDLEDCGDISCEELNHQHAQLLAQAQRRCPDEEV